eukprot:gene37496-45536_t
MGRTTSSSSSSSSPKTRPAVSKARAAPRARGTGTPSNPISFEELSSSSSDSEANDKLFEEDIDNSEDSSESEDDEETRAALATSGNMVRGTRSESTIKQYERTVGFITKKCSQSIPDALDENGALKAPMSKKHIKIFLGLMGKEKSDGSVKARASVEGYVNALKYYFNDVVKKPFKKSTEQFISKYMRGYKRVVVTKKAQGIMKTKEGKVPVTIQAFEDLCRAALFACTSPRSHLLSFVHLFTVLAWNLFARACSVSDLRFNHLSMESDSIVVDFSKTKSDQVGEKTTPKHIYANPQKPHICPFLALALHVFSTASVSPAQLGGGDAAAVNTAAHKIFPGAPYDSYSKWLILALQHLANLGNAATDFGTHSFRKGVVSYSGGFLGGPGIIAIFLRAGWSLGGVQD